MAKAKETREDEGMTASFLEQQLVDEMRSAQYATPDIEVTMAITSDGLLYASTDLSATTDQELVGGILSTAMGLGESVLIELERGYIEMIYLSGSKGIVALRRISEEYLLVMLANPNVRLGMLFSQMKKLAEKLREKLGGTQATDFSGF